MEAGATRSGAPVADAKLGPESNAESNAKPNAQKGLAGAIFLLILLCLVNAFSYVDRSMLALVLPQLTQELELSDTISGLVAGLPFALCYAVCAIPAAWVADNHNRRNLLAAALAFWSVVTVLTGAVQNGWQLAAARFGLGAGEAAGHPTTASLIADSFELKNRTAAFSALSASAYLGPLVGFPIVGWLLEDYGWRMAYFTVGSAGVVVAILFFILVREPKRGRIAGKKEGDPFLARIKQLLRTPSFRFVIFAGGFNAINQGAHITWGPTFLDRVHELNPQEIGVFFGSLRGAAGLAGALFAAVIIGSLVRRDIRWQIRAGIVIAAMPFFSDALFLLSEDPNLWRIGLGLTAFFTAIAVAMSYPLYVNVAPSDLRATASALYFLVASLMGFILGPFCVGALTDYFSPTMGPRAIAVAMTIVSASALISAVLLLMAGRTWVEDVAKAEAG